MDGWRMKFPKLPEDMQPNDCKYCQGSGWISVQTSCFGSKDKDCPKCHGKGSFTEEEMLLNAAVAAMNKFKPELDRARETVIQAAKDFTFSIKNKGDDSSVIVLDTAVSVLEKLEDNYPDACKKYREFMDKKNKK